MAKSKQTGKVTPVKVDSKDCAARVEAVNKALAMLECTLDGTVVTANENFLKVVGYTLDEVKVNTTGSSANRLMRPVRNTRTFGPNWPAGSLNPVSINGLPKGERKSGCRRPTCRCLVTTGSRPR